MKSLNTNLYFANIKIVLATIIIIYALLIFPIFISGNIHLSKENMLLKYSINAFGLFKVLYGYLEVDDEGIIIHLTKNKAVLIKFKDFLTIRKKFKPLKDYHLLKFKSTLEVGGMCNNLIIMIASLYTFISEMVGEIFNKIKPHFQLENTVNIYENSNEINYKCKVDLVFNLLMVIISVIKIIMEKIIYAIKNREQQNKQCN